MKLAKKMLASVIALAMVAALALTAFAAGPQFKITASKAVVGETMTVTISGVNIAGLESADLVMTYDADILEYVGNNDDGIVGEAIPAAGVSTPGEANCSIMVMSSVTKDADVAKYTFKVLKEGEVTFDLKVDDITGLDSAAGDTVTITAAEKATTAEPTPDTTAPVVPVEPGSNGGVTPTKPSITQTGEASIAAIAGVMAVAAVAFVATRKKDEE